MTPSDRVFNFDFSRQLIESGEKMAAVAPPLPEEAIVSLIDGNGDACVRGGVGDASSDGEVIPAVGMKGMSEMGAAGPISTAGNLNLKKSGFLLGWTMKWASGRADGPDSVGLRAGNAGLTESAIGVFLFTLVNLLVERCWPNDIQKEEQTSA